MRAELRGCTTNYIKLEAKQWARDAISGPLVVSQAKKRGSEPAPGFHAKRAVMNPTASPPLFPARIEVVNPKRRDSVPFPAPGSLPRFLQALYQRFFRRLFLGFTTRVHYLNSCKTRGAGVTKRAARSNADERNASLGVSSKIGPVLGPAPQKVFEHPNATRLTPVCELEDHACHAPTSHAAR